MGLAAMLLGERLTSGMLLGGALILVGVWIVDRAHAPTPALPLPGEGRGQG
jgi:drug/metabolite transporter (DMT)-like permease